MDISLIPILVGLLFFILFFSLSMLTLFKTADHNSLRYKVYYVLAKIKHFEQILAFVTTHSSVAYAIFVFGICIASCYVDYVTATKSIELRVSTLRYEEVTLILFSLTEKILDITIYAAVMVPYFILMIKSPDTTLKSKDSFILYKLPNREHYCRNCKRNTQKFDHCCAWVGKCIGAGNNLWFALFLTGTFYANFCHLIINIIHFEYIKELSVSEIFHFYAPLVCQTIMFAIISVFIGPFAYMHMKNIFQNETTFERLKRKMLISKIEKGEFYLSRTFEFVSENSDVFEKEAAIRIIKENYYNKGILGNLKEAVLMGCK